MKKCSSVVWRFFERIEENNRCVSVLCKLCETQYKYFGNTTNLRVHLINRHPIQWELSQNGSLDASQFRINEEDTSTPALPKRRKYTRRTPRDHKVRYSVSVDKEDAGGFMPKIEIQRVNVDGDIDSDNEDNDATVNLVRQMHTERHSDEEWLEEDPYHITHIETYEPKPKRKMKHKIKREISSPTDLPGFYVAPKEQRIVYEETQSKDEYSVFGEYVANKLRKIRTPRTRGNLQQLITTILWQAEYGMYDNAEAVKRVLMYTAQSEPEQAAGHSTTLEFAPQIQVVQSEEIIEPGEPNQSGEIDGLAD